ncbi:MAG: hypothetical protein G01um101431_1116 [Parcubacteria group bacterium Gr01-1014_31]|nr:MAG: hypothetical protein G01um101431_1116 [Parcubacteria group bacterium Gr01-1014_31]
MANSQRFGGEQLEDIFDAVDPAAAAARPSGAGRAAPPPNLPGADVFAPAAPEEVRPPREDGMLPPLPPAPPRPAPVAQADDIFSGVERSRPLVRQPRPGFIPTGQGMGPQRPAATAAEAERSFPTEEEQSTVAKQPPLLARRSFIIGLVTLLGLAALGTGAWVAYTYWQASQTPSSGTPQPQETPAENITPIPSATPEPSPTAPIPEISATPEPVPAEVETDTDHDGLTDREEELYGTNKYATDTDADGLTDRDETKVFGTEPTNPDTDGDGYQDGAEVLNGYNPKGGGRIKEVPPQP